MLPALTLWFSYVISEKGFRGLPIFFFLMPSFWRKLKHLKPGKSCFDLKNIAIGFKVKQKACKKKKDV